jgi:hypothetical protein
MKKLFLVSVVAIAVMVEGHRRGLPASGDVLAAAMQPAPTPCPVPPATPAAPTLTDDPCLAVSEDVHRAELIGLSYPDSASDSGCNRHGMQVMTATCTYGSADRVYVGALPTSCPVGGVCGAYHYGIFQNTDAMNTDLRRPIVGSQPTLSTAFQADGAEGGGGTYGFACFILASTNQSGSAFTWDGDARRFVEYCFTQWKVGGGFPAEYTAWRAEAHPSTGSLLSTHFPGATGGDECEVSSECSLSSVTGVCATATSTATVDTVHVTYATGPNEVVTDYMPTLVSRAFKIDARYVDRVLAGCGRGVGAGTMRVVGHKTGLEGGGFAYASARHQILAISYP